MANEVCMHYAQCPVFNDMLQGMEMTAKNYKRQYCEAGEAGYTKCKRYLVKQRVGKVPSNLLPNSTKSVEEIIASM